MDVKIKDFNVEMLVKNKGIEFEIRETQGKGGDRLGDVVLNKTGLIWCKGKTTAQNGKPVSWSDFIDWVESR